MSRARKQVLVGLAAIALAIPIVWACAGGPESPTWAVRKPDYDGYGNSAMLAPSNDTRVNLALLLADRTSPPPGETGPAPLFTWNRLRDQIVPHSDDEPMGSTEGSRCQTRTSGAEAFSTAVAANSSLPAPEKDTLLAARKGFAFDCADSGAPTVPSLALDVVKSPQGQQFGQYLRGAAAFYAGDFTAATSAFSGLADARDGWLRETALYMVARSQLNLAQKGAFDEWGGIASPRKNDMAAAQASISGLRAYLRAYPNGRYAASAQGLLRRAFWLGGKDAELSSADADWLAHASGPATVDAAEELDNKLFFTADVATFTDPTILAVTDLMRMRKAAGDSGTTRKPIDRAELERQKLFFASQPDLYSYLLAAEALYLRNSPGEVLELIPDASHQPQFSYLQFSRQMLRGMALEQAGDGNARQFWLDLFAGAKQPWQRDALELAYAMHEERHAGLAHVFAKDSPVRNGIVREILLEFVAGPDLLRRQGRDAGLPQRERDAAIWVLLAKDLRHGFYREFLTDVKLVPAGASAEGGSLTGAQNWSSDYNPAEDKVPLGVFTGQASNGTFGCPALAETVAALARNPQAAKPRLCLGEFWRSNGFDVFAFDTPLTPGELGGTPSLFPGKPLARQDIYRSVMNDRTATPDEQAYALYRAVRCYAPSGNNDCGGADVPVTQRRAWYNRLKAQYPGSRWAQSLKFYW
jgi:hypothetical protein